ncbi:MAG: DUF4355 domain-containing protein [Tyzzerella sp.]|nr:DUF4355 domain-containing protein [Tyzzerella sp.]
MGNFKPIETQEELDTVIGERLKRERETVKKEYEGFLSPDDAAKKYAGYLSPEDEKKKYKDYLSPEEAAKKDAKIKGYETDSVKTRIANELGLSYDAVGFLKGEDEESIRKSAEILKGLVGAAAPAPLANLEPDPGKATDVALKNTLKGLKGE